MSAKETIIKVLNSDYGRPGLLKYSESDDEIRFQLPTPIRGTQAAVFRSGAAVLNELTISHRLSLLVGRAKCGVPEDFAFAIKAIQSAVYGIDVVDGYDVSLRFEVETTRRDTITALRSTLVTKYGNDARITKTSFNVLAPSLANFVRRQRQLLDFSDLKINRDKSYLSTVAEDHFRYYPSEHDRLSDGRRVDHVPALTLIDIGLSVNGMAHPGAVHSNISAEFMNYADPRQSFDMLQKAKQSAIEFMQNGQLVAIIYTTANLPVPSKEGNRMEKLPCPN